MREELATLYHVDMAEFERYPRVAEAIGIDRKLRRFEEFLERKKRETLEGKLHD